MSTTRIAINGFGRIGRMAFKVARTKPELEVVAINDLSDAHTLAYLLQYDSVHGRYDAQVRAQEGAIVVDGHTYPVLNEKDPRQLPWSDLNVDIVIEATGVFTKQEQLAMHTEAGAHMVLLSAPAKGDGIATILQGVNAQDLTKDTRYVSHASCTTTCISPVMAVLENAFGVESSLMTTIHAYTATQELVDGAQDDLRRGRAAAINMVPTSTGAARATGQAIPSLQETFDGMAIRVPVANGSLADITAVLKTSVTVEDVNTAFTHASQENALKGILAVSNEPIVSSDIIGRSESAIIDLPFTTVVGGTLVKVLAWYDNEAGYSHRLVEQAIQAGKVLRA